jgi:hypothetical protein
LTGDVAEDLEVQIDFPAGLYRVVANENGESIAGAWVDVDIEYKAASWGQWVTWKSGHRITGRGPEYKSFVVGGLSVDPAAGRYSVRVRMVRKSGSTASYITMAKWTRLSAIIRQPMSHPNKALLGVKIKATEQLSGGIPTVTWKQTRNTVLVRDGAAWVEKDAQNPAWIIYDLCVKARRLSSVEVVVFGENPSRMDLPMFKAWVEWNGREINNRPAIKMNLMIDDAKNLWEWANEIAASGRGAVVLKGTRISCIWDQPADPVQLFTMGNIKAGSFSGEFLPLEYRANAVEISFNNEAKNFEREQITVYADGFDSGMANPVAVQLTGITDFERAYREGVYRLNQNKYLLRTVSFAADVDAIACQVGDVILVQHDVPRWGQGGRILAVSGNDLTLDHIVRMEEGISYQIMVRLQDDTRVTLPVTSGAGESDTVTVSDSDGINAYDVFALGEAGKTSKPFRVQTMSRTGDLTVDLTCLEYIPELYTEPGAIPEMDYTTGVNLITHVELAPGGYYGFDSVWIRELWAYWDYRGRRPIAYDVEWKHDDGLWGYGARVTAAAAQCPLRDTTSLYSVRIRGLFGDLPPTDWAYATFESRLLGVGIAPDAPSDLAAAGWFGFAQLSWSNPPNVDLAYIEVWEGNEDDRSKAVHIGQAAAPSQGYTRLIAAGATRWYWIRAVNHADQKSDFNAPEGTPCVIAPENHEAYMTALLEANPYLRGTIEGLGERIDPIEDEIPRIRDVIIPDLSGRIRDAEYEIQGRITPALDRVSQGVIRLADESDRTRNVFRWAGIEVDEKEGTVVIRAVEDLKTETGYRLTDVGQRLDAQKADISLRATRTYVDELAASLISSIVVTEEWKFAGDLNGWTAQNASLEALPASMKYAVEAADPSLTSPDVELDGETNNIVSIQFRQDAGTSPVKLRIQYKTENHGYSDSYMKRVDMLGNASVFRSVQADMHGLDAGGDDWKDSTVTGLRVCLGEDEGEEYEISLVNVGQNSLTDVALEDLKMRVTQAEADIDGANAVIALKADQTSVEGLIQRLGSAEIDIDGLKSSITLKAEKAELTPLEIRISGAEAEINALEGRISQQVMEYQETFEQMIHSPAPACSNNRSYEPPKTGIDGVSISLYSPVL